MKSKTFSLLSKAVLVGCLFALVTTVSAETISLDDYIPLEVGRYWTFDRESRSSKIGGSAYYRDYKWVIRWKGFEGGEHQAWRYYYTEYSSQGKEGDDSNFRISEGTNELTGAKFVWTYLGPQGIPVLVFVDKVPFHWESESRSQHVIDVSRNTVRHPETGEWVTGITMVNVKRDRGGNWVKSIVTTVKGFGMTSIELFFRGRLLFRYEFKTTGITDK